ncbi:ArgS-related anticodon-binding protein NrtL [Streptomyces sp. NPDC002776]
MTPVELSRTVLRAVRRAVDEGELRVAVPERAVVTVPGPGGCGDYATNIALQLARPAGQTPQRVAEILRPHLAGADGVDDVVVTGPGFINFRLRDAAPIALVEDILRRGSRYGFADGPSGQVVQLHCPHEVRAVVVMDAVARILRSQGALVRTSCEARPEQAWQDVLGVDVDAYGRPAAPAPLDVNVRPVPAPGDPVPLGADAARWALLYPAAHDRPRITDEHLVQRESNPLFRVRYAHARIRATARNAAALGFTAQPDPTPTPTTPPAALGIFAEPGPAPTPTAATAPASPPAALGVSAEPGPAPTSTTPPAPASHTADLGVSAEADPARAPHPAGPALAPEAAPTQALGRTAAPARAPHAALAPASYAAAPAITEEPGPTPSSTAAPAPTPQPTLLAAPPEVTALTTPLTALPEATPLITPLADHPRILAAAATHHAPDRLARHLVTVADAVLVLLPAVLPRGAEKPSVAHRSRLALAEAAGAVLAGGLSLLGIDAPEHL